MADEPKDDSLPAFTPWLIAAVVLAIAVAAFLGVTKAAPVAEGAIAKVFAVQPPGQERVLVGVEVHIKNVYVSEIVVRGVEVKMQTADAVLTDQASPASDQAKFFQAFPDFKQSDAPPLAFDTKIEPGEEKAGLVVVSYPVPKSVFDGRKSIEATIRLYGQKPLILKK